METDPGEAGDPRAIAFDVLGVGVVVRLDGPNLAQTVRASLPVGALVRDERPGDAELSIAQEGEIGALRDALLRHTATNAPERVLVRAGVVALGHRAIVLLGGAEAGTADLVAALVRAGGAFYADTYVALDSSGLVHPFERPPRHIEELGAAVPRNHVHVALVAQLGQRDEAELSLAACSRDRAVELLLEHMLGDEPQRELAMRAAQAAAEHAIALEGDRDGADAAAAALLARLAGPTREEEQEVGSPAIRFATLVFELEAQLVELAGKLDAAGIEAVLLNGDQVGPALIRAFPDSLAALLSIPDDQVPRALGLMETEGWRQTGGAGSTRYFRRGVVVRIQRRPRSTRLARMVGRDPGPTAKGRLGFAEPAARLQRGAAVPPRRPEPFDPGGPLRTGVRGAVTQLAAEALTVLDGLRMQTREREFRGLRVQYGPGVFGFETVTERHVDSILAHLPGDGSGTRFVEVGTATGAVALAVALERPGADVLATDVSLRALGWTRRNRRRFGAKNVRMAQGSLLAPVPAEWRGSVTAIAANPPLAPPRGAIELSGTSGWPRGTTTGPGADGLGLVRALVRDAAAVLAVGGHLCLQLQGHQAPLIAPYLATHGYETEVPEGVPAGAVELAARWTGRAPAAGNSG